MNDRPVLIGTRGSALALAQAGLVRDLLRAAHPRLRFELKIIRTSGDKMKTASLARRSESTKGLFTKELEQALLRQHIDLAVHSCKDLPTDIPPGLQLAAVPRREDARDAFLSRQPGPLPATGIVATSSIRRKAQLLARFPSLQVVDIRGNVETRLRKLVETTEWQGILLAAAGLKRLGLLRGTDTSGTLQWDPPIAFQLLPLTEMLPAVGQAALAIEIRDGDERIESLVAPLNHFASFAAVRAERAFLRARGGGCQTPLAAHAIVSEGRLTLRAAVFAEDGSNVRTAEISGAAREAESLGAALAGRL